MCLTVAQSYERCRTENTTLHGELRRAEEKQRYARKAGAMHLGPTRQPRTFLKQIRESSAHNGEMGPRRLKFLSLQVC